MADVRPFQSVRYDLAKVGDLASVLCPPYDIISPEQQRELHARSEYNFVHVEQAYSLPADTPQDNKYTRSASTLRMWLERGVLKRDSAPALYLHDHLFGYQGKPYWRRGLIACVALEEWGGSIRPHETTLSAPRQDRIELLRACRANTSPIWGLYEDRKEEVASLLAVQAERQPLVDLSLTGGERHVLWSIDDPSTIGRIQRQLDGRVYIADGHHRYEMALAYKTERLAAQGESSGKAAWNYVMMTLVDFADLGLLILPVHRLVRGLRVSVLETLKMNLERVFRVETVDQSGSAGRPDSLLARMQGKETHGRTMGLVGLESGLFLLAWNENIEREVASRHSPALGRLGAGIFEHIVKEYFLGNGEVTVDYTSDASEAAKKVQSGEYQLAFLLNPVPAAMIKEVGDSGERMPGKTTYFHPKLPAGLVLNLLDGEM